MNRRHFLRGVGALGAALPFLTSLPGRSSAAPTTRPRRYIGMFTASGTVKNAWTPTGTESAFTLGEVLRPLDALKSELLIVNGLNMVSTKSGPGGAHQKGTGHLFTGIELQEGSFVAADGTTAGFANGMSIDQLIASRVGKDTRLKSIELGVQTSGNDVGARISYGAPGVSLAPINDPAVAFDRLFGGLAGDPGAAAALRAERRSVLDGVTSQFQALNAKLSAEDRIRLDAHLTAVRDVESRLGAGALTTCTIPGRPTAIDLKAVASFPVIGKLQMDLLVLALACDVTRVGTLQWSRSVSPTVYSFLDPTIKEAHHELSHAGDADTVARAKLIKINRFLAENFAYLVDKLKKIEDAPGQSLLDNTVVCWGNELSVGNTHSRDDMPFVIAGRGGGSIVPGRWVQGGGRAHNDLLVALANAAGLTDVKTFGNAKYCAGPLPKIVTA